MSAFRPPVALPVGLSLAAPPLARTDCGSMLELKIWALAGDHVVEGEGMDLWWQTYCSVFS